MFECRKCKKKFGLFESSCGTGWSWGLYRCPHCQQLHAMATVGGFIPDEVLKDKEIIVIDSFRPTPRAVDGAKYCPECGQGVVGFLGKCEICGYNPPRS